ncbi:hypothetical protein BH11BAC5_BH11BAC5_20490 [soil metagenome]
MAKFQADIGNYFYKSINAITLICQHIENKNKKWGDWQLIIGIDFSGTIKREFYVVNIIQYFRSGSLSDNYYFFPYKNNLITCAFETGLPNK